MSRIRAVGRSRWMCRGETVPCHRPSRHHAHNLLANHACQPSACRPASQTATFRISMSGNIRSGNDPPPPNSTVCKGAACDKHSAYQQYSRAYGTGTMKPHLATRKQPVCINFRASCMTAPSNVHKQINYVASHQQRPHHECHTAGMHACPLPDQSTTNLLAFVSLNNTSTPRVPALAAATPPSASPPCRYVVTGHYQPPPQPPHSARAA